MPVSQEVYPAFPVDGLPVLVERCKDGGYRLATHEPLKS